MRRSDKFLWKKLWKELEQADGDMLSQDLAFIDFIKETNDLGAFDTFLLRIKAAADDYERSTKRNPELSIDRIKFAY